MQGINKAHIVWYTNYALVLKNSPTKAHQLTKQLYLEEHRNTNGNTKMGNSYSYGTQVFQSRITSKLHNKQLSESHDEQLELSSHHLKIKQASFSTSCTYTEIMHQRRSCKHEAGIKYI